MIYSYDILNVREETQYEDSITSAEFRNYQPIVNSFKNNDEFRIKINYKDNYIFPKNSFLHIEGRVLKTADDKASATTKFVNNGIAFLFQEIRYELGGVMIDSIRNPGIATTMKAFCSFNSDDNTRAQNAGWFAVQDSTIINADGNFNVSIPLTMLLGFFENFSRVTLNMEHELIFLRSSTDTDALINTTAGEGVKVILDKVMWQVPHIAVSDSSKIEILNILGSNINLDIAFRGWELYEYPLLPLTNSHSWPVKTTTPLEKPRFIIFGLQTNRKEVLTQDVSKFDHCNLKNVRVFLNDVQYPYHNLNLDFSKDRIAELYNMYTSFRSCYYDIPGYPFLSRKQFKEIAPLVVINCNLKNKNLICGTVDFRIEFETNANVPAKTSAFALVLHDREVQYTPSNGSIRIKQT